MPSSESGGLTTEQFYEALLDDDIADLYENAPCGYVSTSPDGTIIKVNATFLTWTGLERSDLVGRRRFADLLTPGGRIFYETHIAPMLRMQDRVREIAVEVQCPEGQRLPVLVNGVLKRDAEGHPLVVRIAVFDATERRSYERELLEARKRAEASETKARALAQTLQASFIPAEPPTVPGVDLAAYYRPAGAGDEVGGDFYDVFATARGDWAVILGDVCGKGAEAATVTSLARYTARAAAMLDPRPSHVLGTLNAAILRQQPDRFCTAVYVRIETSDAGPPRLTICSGGHNLPLHVRGGEVVTVGVPGTLLGAFDDVDLVDTHLELGSGESLVLYTDGVTEARHRDGAFYGDERLRRALRTPAEGAADLVSHLAEEVVAFQHGAPRDDIAVLALMAQP